MINPISFFICNFVRTGVHRVRGCSDPWYDCGVPKEVCVLKGIKSLIWWLCVCNLVFYYLVDTQRFLGTGCSFWCKSEPV